MLDTTLDVIHLCEMQKAMEDKIASRLRLMGYSSYRIEEWSLTQSKSALDVTFIEDGNRVTRKFVQMPMEYFILPVDEVKRLIKQEKELTDIIYG